MPVGAEFSRESGHPGIAEIGQERLFGVIADSSRSMAASTQSPWTALQYAVVQAIDDPPKSS
jgi:hypothetical protein